LFSLSPKKKSTQNIKRYVCVALIFAITAQPMLVFSSPIEVDRQASSAHQASLNIAANGVPIVEITAPSKAGVSMNAFTEYNVGREGLILNNSADIVQTQLGGYIQGNPNFSANQNASLIVNQVTSQSLSNLNGYTEIGGHQAELIIANPNGISCDGCGFINTNKTTLTTGVVNITSQGFNSIDVRKGKITINGLGLNMNNIEQAELIAQAIEINADLYGQSLQLIAGKNSVSSDGTVSAIAEVPNPPQLAIHLSSESSIFANDIQMLATEKGVGVNSEGLINSAGAFTLSADGKITFTETAIINAGETLRVESKSAALAVDGELLAKEDISLIAATDIVTGSESIIYAGAQSLGDESVRLADLNLSAESSISNQGKLLSSDGLTITANDIANQSLVVSEGDLVLQSVQAFNNAQGKLITKQNLTIQAQGVNNQEGIISSYQQLAINHGAQGINNQWGNINSLSDIHLSQFQNQNQFQNDQGSVNGAGTVLLSFNDVYEKNQGSGVVQGGVLDLSSKGFVLNDDWFLAGDLRLTSSDAVNINQKLHTEGVFEIDVNSIVDVNIGTNGELKSGSVEPQALSSIDTLGSVNNRGIVSAKNNLELNAGVGINNYLNGANGIGAKQLTLKAQNKIVNESLLYGVDFLGLFSTEIHNKKDIVSSGDLIIAGSAYDDDLLAFNLANVIWNDARTSTALISSAGDMEIHASSILNESRTLLDHELNIYFEAPVIFPPIMGWSGKDANQGLFFPIVVNDIDTKGQHNSMQTVIRQGAVSYTGNNFTLAQIQAGNNLVLEAGDEGIIENKFGQITAKNNLDIHAKQLINKSVTHQVRTDVRIDYFDTLRRDATEERNFFLTTADYDDYERCTQNNVACYKPYYTNQAGDKIYINTNIYEVRNSVPIGNDLYLFYLVDRRTGQFSPVVSSTPYGVLSDLLWFSDRIIFGIVLGDEDGFAEVSGRYISRYQEEYSLHMGPNYSLSNVSIADVKGITGDGVIKAGGIVNIDATQVCNTGDKTCIKQDSNLPEIALDFAVDNVTIDSATDLPEGGCSEENPVYLLDPITGQPTALDPLNNFILPTGGLFSVSSNPNHPYLIETNPLLTDYNNFISSDYLFDQLGWNADDYTKRIGDGYYEMSLIDQVIRNASATGTINYFRDSAEQFKYLMDNAVAAQQDMQLAMGISLTKEQVNDLNASMVWMEYQIVNGEKVLVPIVYLVNFDEYQAEGALIAGNGLNITGGSLTNRGQLYGSEYLAFGLDGDLKNLGGQINSRGSLNAAVGGDLYNSGEIKASTVKLDVAGDITHETLVTQVHSGDDTYTHVNEVANITSTQGDLIQQAGGDYLAIAAHSNSAGNQSITAENIYLLAAQTASAYKVGRGKNFNQHQETDYLVSELSSEGDLILNANNSILGEGAQFSSEDDIYLMAKNGNVDLLAVEATSQTNISRSYSSGPSHNKTKVSTTTEARSSHFSGSEINAKGNLVIDAGNQINLEAIQASVGDGAEIKAVNEVNIISLANTEASHTLRRAKSHTSYRNTDKGFIEQSLAQASISAGEGLNINSEKEITLVAVNLATRETLSLNAQSVQKNENGEAMLDEEGNFLTEDGSTASVNSKTLALITKSWNDVESGKRGVAATLDKAAAVIETGLKDLVQKSGLDSMMAGIKGESMSAAFKDDNRTEVKLGEQDSYREKNIVNVGSSFVAENLLIQSDDNIHLTNIDIANRDESGERSAMNVVQMQATNIILDAAADTHEVIDSRGTNSFAAEGGSYSKGEYQVAAFEDNKSTTSTQVTTTTYQGGDIFANSVNLDADQSLALLSADVTANYLYTDAKNTIIGGYQNSTEINTTNREESVRTSVGVRNSYVDVGIAANEFTHSLEALEDAEDAYQDAKSLVAQGKMNATDLEYHEANLAAATLNATNAQIALAQSGAAVAASSATAGFTVSAKAEHSVSESQAQESSKVWNGSNINVGNWVATGDDLVIQGSQVNVTNVFDVQVKDVHLLAGENVATSNFNSSTQTGGASANSTGNVGVSASNQQSDAETYDLTHINTQLNIGTLKVNNNSLTLEGAEVVAQNLDIKTNQLSVISLQDVHRSSNSSEGTNIGLSVSGMDGVDLSGPSLGAKASDGDSNKRWVENQSILIGTQTANIKADVTTLTGGMIANAIRDEDGSLSDLGNLNFATNTLVMNNLVDTDYAKQSGFNVSTSFSETQGVNNQGEVEAYNNGSTTIGGHNNGHTKEQLTLATLGVGNVTVGGQAISETEFADINRDVQNAQIITEDKVTGGLDASVTVDQRLFSEAGRNDIKQDEKELGLLMQETSNAMPSANDEGIAGEVGQVLNLLGTATLGLLPSDKNDGGLMANIPVLFPQGDIKHQVIGDGKFVYVNGMMNTFEDAEAGQDDILGAGIAEEDRTLWFNPTHGFLPDLLESAVDFLGNPLGYQTGISIQAEQYQEDNKDKYIHLHSQAHLIFQAGAQNSNIKNNHNFFSYGSPGFEAQIATTFANDKNDPINPNRNDGDYVSHPLNIFNPLTWSLPGHGTENYGASALEKEQKQQ